MKSWLTTKDSSDQEPCVKGNVHKGIRVNLLASAKSGRSIERSEGLTHLARTVIITLQISNGAKEGGSWAETRRRKAEGGRGSPDKPYLETSADPESTARIFKKPHHTLGMTQSADNAEDQR